MSTVAEIIEAVKQLSEEEKGALLEQLGEVDFDDAWDREIEADAKAGKLDFLWEEAQREIAQGTARPLDEFFRDK
jgi:hypothetical protein